MSEIAIIKWFGNSRNERHSNYKILECEDGRRLDIHASEISCSEDELRRGRFINFEIEEKEAKKLRLLREVGVIDWYRSDKGFGCATLLRNEPDLWEMFEICQNGTAEVFVHINQVSSGSQELKRGDIVVCDIRKTYRKDKNKYRDDALNLTLLSEETDEEIIEGCAKSEDPRLWLPVFHKYLNTLQTTDEKVSVALEKINKQSRISEPRQVAGIRKEPFEVKFSLHIPHSLSTPSPQSFSDSLPDEILRCSPEIRRFLSLEKHLNVITLALMEEAKCNNLPQDLLLTELQSCLENLNPLNEAWNKIPDWILQEDKIWSLVPTNRRASILLAQLDNPSTYQNTVDKIVDLLNSSPGNERNFLISQIPLKVKCHKNIFPLLPVTDKIEVIISHIQDAKDANEPLDTLLNELEVGLKQVEHYSNVWNKIPTDILLKQQIWYLVPANRQTSVVLSQLDTSSSYENTIDLLAELLYKCSGSERTSLISRIPDNAKQHDKIFLLLPATDQFQILVEQLRESEPENASISSQIETIVSNLSLSERQSIISKLPVWVKEIPSIRASLFRIPSVRTRPDTPEASQIRAFIAERGIFCLCHFTTIENLQGIYREGGLLSIYQLQSRNSHYDQIDQVRVDGNLNHICCSINSYNERYLYRARLKHETKCWVLLTIKPDYLWKQGTLFCPINAASQWGAHIKKGFAGLKSMYEPVVTDRKGTKHTREGLPARKPTCIQAEVQVHESISLDDVLRIVVATPIDEQKVRDVGWKGEVTILPGLFK
jgi:cold shock CspA family protein